jgi:hypothetical protein
MCFLIFCLCFVDLIFLCQKSTKVFSKREFFFLRIGKYVCQKIQNFMLISYLKEYFGKKSALEKLDPANRSSEDLGLFPTEKVWCTASPI